MSTSLVSKFNDVDQNSETKPIRPYWFLATVMASTMVWSSSPFSISVLILLISLPIWAINDLRRDGWQKWNAIFLLGFLASGALLPVLSELLGRKLDLDMASKQVWFICTLSALFAIMRMAVVRQGLPTTLVAYALGQLLSLSWLGLNTANPWKYDLSAPIAILLLVFTGTVVRRQGRRKSLPYLVFVILTVTSIALDYRSMAGICAMSSAVYAISKWNLGSRRKESSNRKKLLPVIFAGMAAATYFAFNQLALSGSLGQEIYQRSASQVALTGSLLLGGRPEWAATVELFRNNPIGFGPGVSPTSTELSSAFHSLDQIGVGSTNPYVREYLFGNSIELHSEAADLWARFGFVGLIFSLIAITLLVRGLGEQALSTDASPAAILVMIWALWGIFFGPIYSDGPLLVTGLVAASTLVTLQSRNIVEGK